MEPYPLRQMLIFAAEPATGRRFARAEWAIQRANVAVVGHGAVITVAVRTNGDLHSRLGPECDVSILSGFVRRARCNQSDECKDGGEQFFEMSHRAKTNNRFYKFYGVSRKWYSPAATVHLMESSASETESTPASLISAFAGHNCFPDSVIVISPLDNFGM